MADSVVNMEEARESIMKVINYLTINIPDATDLVKTLLSVSDYIQDHANKLGTRPAEDKEGPEFQKLEDPDNETMLLMPDSVCTEDGVVADRALCTLPKYLTIKHSKVCASTVGVFADVALSCQTCFGPFEGELVDCPDDNISSCIWQISTDTGVECYISGSNPTKANWMRFVACTSAAEQHNLQAFQHDGKIFYRATCAIKAGSELVVCYECTQAQESTDIEECLIEGEDVNMYENLGGLDQDECCCVMCGVTFEHKDMLTIHMEEDHELSLLPGIDASLCGLKEEAALEEDNVEVKKQNKKLPRGKSFKKDENIKPRKKRRYVRSNPRNSPRNGKRSIPINKLKGYDAEIGKYKCDKCDRVFDIFSQYTYHSRQHTGEKPFQCQDCGRCFRVGAQLKVHELTHTSIKPHICKTCDRAFTQYSNLKRHMRTHTGEKPYKCDQCARSFSDGSSFKCHLRLHTGEKPYSCEVCGKRFISVGSMTVHQQTHNTQRQHRCENCGKSFKGKYSYNQHKSNCEGLVQLKCPKCKELFIGMDMLDMHMESHLIDTDLMEMIKI